MVLKENPDQPLASLEVCWLWGSQEESQELSMMLGLGTCGTWTGTDLSSPNGPLLKWEWVKTGHISWLMLLTETTPDQIP